MPLAWTWRGSRLPGAWWAYPQGSNLAEIGEQRFFVFGGWIVSARYLMIAFWNVRSISPKRETSFQVQIQSTSSTLVGMSTPFTRIFHADGSYQSVLGRDGFPLTGTWTASRACWENCHQPSKAKWRQGDGGHGWRATGHVVKKRKVAEVACNFTYFTTGHDRLV